MRILLAEDDHTFSHILTRTLEKEKYLVDLASDGENAIYKAKTESYALILLDLRLPLKNGFEVCRLLRRAKIQTPILMLTAVSEEFGAATGLDLGADDYLRKPFELQELLARIRALLRREPTPLPNLLTYKNLTLDPRTHRVYYKKDQEIPLNNKEYQLLQFFLYNPDRALSTQEILENVWGQDLAQTNSNTLEVYIHRLRRLLKKYHLDQNLHTIRGYGYELTT